MTDHSAAPAALGYFYQAQWALLELIRGSRIRPDCRISLELFDDVAWDDEGSPVELLQIKHHLLGSRLLGDLDDDLWRTIGAWLDSGPAEDVDGPLLTLVTTQTARDGSAVSFLRPTDPDFTRSHLLLEDAARRSTSKATLSTRRRFLAMHEPSRRIFISRMRVLDATPGLQQVDTALRLELRLSLPVGFEDQAMERVWGWWSKRVLELLQRICPNIGATEVHLFLNDLRAQYTLDNLPTFDELRLVEEDLGAFGNRPFVHQLRWVATPDVILRTAILDYYRAYAHTSKWLKDDLVGLEELDRFEAALKDEWARAFAWATSELAEPADDVAKESAGRALLERTLAQTAIRVRDRYSEPFFSRGKHHELADDGEIGWHPDFEAKLRVLLLGKSA